MMEFDLFFSLAGCAAGPCTLVDPPDEDGDVGGFWQGLWHGLITPISFIVSLFKDSVAIYAVHNNGGWYDAGFLLALTAVWGGGSRVGRRSKWIGGGPMSAAGRWRIRSRIVRGFKTWSGFVSAFTLCNSAIV